MKKRCGIFIMLMLALITFFSISVTSVSADYDPYDLSDYAYRTVSSGGRGNLIFQKSPDGAFMTDHQYRDGDSIYVNVYWRQGGYALAYDNGVYGYVDANYIDFEQEGSASRYDPHDLSDFDYRTVVTRGRGTLVFQKSPNGPFMYDYEFTNGDRIYVNTYWRQDGYALAYKDGTYGYVDAGYIDWDSIPGIPYNPYALGDFAYRTVRTGRKGNLIFQTEPNGSFMNSYQFSDGDSIFVNLYYRDRGYALACKDGIYGFVDAKYIDWDDEGRGEYDPYDLSDYAYRTVRTGGKGALVFQSSPDGDFMNRYQFSDGDSIFVNTYWRVNGYALAYQDGVYGYVDAKYIDW